MTQTCGHSSDFFPQKPNLIGRAYSNSNTLVKIQLMSRCYCAPLDLQKFLCFINCVANLGSFLLNFFRTRIGRAKAVDITQRDSDPLLLRFDTRGRPAEAAAMPERPTEDFCRGCHHPGSKPSSPGHSQDGQGIEGGAGQGLVSSLLRISPLVATLQRHRHRLRYTHYDPILL